MRELTFQVEQFLFREAELLDERRFEEWLALYEPDAWYWAPVLADATERGLALAQFDEDRTGMEARIRRLRQSNAYSEHPPTRPRSTPSPLDRDAWLASMGRRGS